VSARQFEEFRASSLYCAACGEAKPVRERLLLVLPDREIHEYLCTVCGESVGTREATAADAISARQARQIAARRGGRQVRIL
jgi:predicted RNA-binding Zn-ribbon protein involved in translation (DUF1610 family)